MTDDFAEFDSESFNPSSPTYFAPQFMESFLKNDLGQFEIPDLMPKNDPFNTFNENPDNRFLDVLSNDSNSSTNYSTKQSPEYADYTDNQSGIERKSEDSGVRCSKAPPVLRKGIQKQYEPILDSDSVYRVDDNATEYKKARKRVQNRESAQRVRNKKKKYVEDLETEMNAVKKENADLRVQNASLRAENSLLKQQTCFLEKMVMKGGGSQQAMSNCPQTYNARDFQECLLPLVNKAEETSSQKSYGYFRAAPPHTLKKNYVMLGVFTLLLCTYGYLSPGEDNSAGGVYPGSVTEFKNSYSLGVKNVDDSTGYGSMHQADLDRSLAALIKANQEYNSLKFMIKAAVTTVYIIYFIYVLLITNWRYVFRIKSYKLL